MPDHGCWKSLQPLPAITWLGIGQSIPPNGGMLYPVLKVCTKRRPMTLEAPSLSTTRIAITWMPLGNTVVLSMRTNPANSASGWLGKRCMMSGRCTPRTALPTAWPSTIISTYSTDSSSSAQPVTGNTPFIGWLGPGSSISPIGAWLIKLSTVNDRAP